MFFFLFVLSLSSLCVFSGYLHCSTLSSISSVIINAHHSVADDFYVYIYISHIDGGMYWKLLILEKIAKSIWHTFSLMLMLKAIAEMNKKRKNNCLEHYLFSSKNDWDKKAIHPCAFALRWELRSWSIYLSWMLNARPLNCSCWCFNAINNFHLTIPCVAITVTDVDVSLCGGCIARKQRNTRTCSGTRTA